MPASSRPALPPALALLLTLTLTLTLTVTLTLTLTRSAMPASSRPVDPRKARPASAHASKLSTFCDPDKYNDMRVGFRNVRTGPEPLTPYPLPLTPYPLPLTP